MLRKLLCMIESERDIQTYNICSNLIRLVSDFNLADPVHKIVEVRLRI